MLLIQYPPARNAYLVALGTYLFIRFFNGLSVDADLTFFNEVLDRASRKLKALIGYEFVESLNFYIFSI